MMQRSPRVRDREYLDFIRSLPCLLCGDNTSVEAAHVRMACAQVDKRAVGIGEKADDCWTVPLCGKHHRSQHTRAERLFWSEHAVDPLLACLALGFAYVNDNREAAERIIRAHNSVTEDNQ